MVFWHVRKLQSHFVAFDRFSSVGTTASCPYCDSNGLFVTASRELRAWLHMSGLFPEKVALPVHGSLTASLSASLSASLKQLQSNKQLATPGLFYTHLQLPLSIHNKHLEMTQVSVSRAVVSRKAWIVLKLASMYCT